MIKIHEIKSKNKEMVTSSLFHIYLSTFTVYNRLNIMELSTMNNLVMSNHERRKFLRFYCSIPSELVELEGKNNLVEGATVLDFSNEGLKLSVNFVEPNPGSETEVVLYIPHKQLITSLTGQVIWSKHVKNKMEVGLKIKDIEKQGMKDILDWVLPRWLEKEKKIREGLFIV